MRKVVLYELVSLDGVAEEPGDWLFDVDGEVFDDLGEVISTQTDVLLGRATHDYWAGYWPGSDVEPFAEFINSTPKHVFTSRPLPVPWSGVRPVLSRVEDHLARLRAEPGGDIGVHGSITLARSLLRAGSVDEMRLVTAPTVAHSGRRLFPEGAARSRWDLLSLRSSPSGTVFAHYRARSG